MKGIIGVIKRLICLAFSQHEWDERTIIRWCVKCLWVQINDPKEGWTYYGYDAYDDSWMTWQHEKKIADELFEYLEYERSLS